MPVDDDDVRDVLRFYPQIYLACHVDHVRRCVDSRKAARGMRVTEEK